LLYQAQSNIYLEFGGDPTLTLSQLSALLQQLNLQGIHTIAGNLVIDDTHFDNKVYGPGWLKTDLNYCFSGPIDAMVINHNCLRMQLLPGAKAGMRTSLAATQSVLRYIRLRNYIFTDYPHPHTSCALRPRVADNGTYFLNGCIPPHSSPQTLAIAIRLLQPSLEEARDRSTSTSAYSFKRAAAVWRYPTTSSLYCHTLL
jgi:serine-type D-Ala-D-Ala carboxypeptidase/endopeptidase (penicillin-binding protein 4)